MTYKKRFRQFLNKYSLRELLASAEALIRNLLKNILNSGNIIWQIALSPILLLTIILLFLIILLKKLILHLHDLLHWFYKLQRNLLVIAVQEINFYWEAAGRTGSNLVSTLSILIKRMFAYLGYLLQKIFDDSTAYSRDDDTGSLTLVGTAVTQLGVWLAVTMFTLGMSVLLLFTFFIGVPLLHRSLRPQPDEPAAAPDTEQETTRTTDAAKQGGRSTNMFSHQS